MYPKLVTAEEIADGADKMPLICVSQSFLFYYFLENSNVIAKVSSLPKSKFGQKSWF